MEVLECNEMFEEADGDLSFSHTKVIVRQSAQYFYATTRGRYRNTSDIDPQTLNLSPIPSSKIWPEYSTQFTRIPTSLLQNCYIKRPSLIYYGDIIASSEQASLLVQEAKICETLKGSPHPNIARYLGCLVEDNKITGLCFVRYGDTLSKIIKRSHIIDRNSCLANIRRGIEHLHQLGIIHCDINPNNIFTDGDSFVIGDFDSCTLEGEKLGLKAGTHGWTDPTFAVAMPQNDWYGLAKIEAYL